MDIAGLLFRFTELETETQDILGTQEESPARAVNLTRSYERLAKLSVDQDELFRESLRAVEDGLFRAAHVIAWAGFVDFLHEHLAADGLAAISAARPKWPNLRVAEDLREHADHAVIEAAKVAGFYPKSVMKGLLGLLNKRNECAHPSEYYPDFNGALGYLSELFQRLEYLQKKRPPRTG